eukprot:TRINITY_DN10607_c0_g1_i1.p1 TRINITY_DN10607_c0_g1~~TRINITY_DN10607_c0_g1_i1.p1  ORF type:complete len:484 (+),score=88.05 TRINITY_DN10607_c0_g1_i1:45-1496(+)
MVGLDPPQDASLGTEEGSAKKRLSLGRMILNGACTSGVNFGYSAEFVFGTPLFATLGLSPFWTSFAWMAGPISGLIALPISGAYSDLCTHRWGRRRPFILAGVVLAVVGMLLFANPLQIARWFGYKTEQGNTPAIVIAIVALWLLNIGLNITQGPSWALVLDLTPSDQQSRSNAVISFMSSFASLTANLIAFINFSAFLHVSNATALFYIGLFFILAFALPTLIGAKEVPLSRALKSELSTEERTHFFRHLWRGVRKINRTTFFILLAFFFTSAAGSPFLFYFTDFMGKDVYKGDPEADPNSDAYKLYDKGVRMGSLGTALSNVISIIFSIAIPYLMDRIGTKPTYWIGHGVVVISGCLPLIKQLRDVPLMMILASMQGFLNACSNIIPYALMARAVSAHDVGMYVGFLSIVQVAGQMTANLIAGAVMSRINYAAGMAVGSAFAFIGIFAILFMIIPPTTTTEITTATENQAEKTPLIAAEKT